MYNKPQIASIVVSVYNEQEVLPYFWARLNELFVELNDIHFEIIFVNDGSKDSSQNIIDSFFQETEKMNNVKIIAIDFSRNFGHESAMLAGIDNASGDLIICLDSDLQHPPSEIPRMIEQYSSGNDIVLMERTKRLDNGLLKNNFSKLFYLILNELSNNLFNNNASDFFLISKQVGQVLQNNFREKNRFIRGYIQIVGFQKKTLTYEAPARVAGVSNYSLGSLFKLGFNAIFIFSNRLLHLSLIVSVFFLFISLALIIYSLYEYFWGKTPPSGYTTIIIFMSISFTVLFFLITILSIYFDKTIEEIRGRPIYIVKNLQKQ